MTTLTDLGCLAVLERIANALERISSVIDSGNLSVRTEDIGRAKVYSEHLGERLKK